MFIYAHDCCSFGSGKRRDHPRAPIPQHPIDGGGRGRDPAGGVSAGVVGPQHAVRVAGRAGRRVARLNSGDGVQQLVPGPRQGHAPRPRRRLLSRPPHARHRRLQPLRAQLQPAHAEVNNDQIQ